MAYWIEHPRPGDKFPSPIEKGGYWKAPKGCVRVLVAEPTGYPIRHVVVGKRSR